MNIWRTGALAAMLWLLATGANAQSPGVLVDTILFGQSAALGGPAARLGSEMRRGILAAFEEVNRAGGVNGRRLELRSYDDRYEPEQAVANTLKLINDDHVFALIGAVGTPTAAATEPIALAEGVPLIAPFTGADFLRDPALTNVVNIRASYSEETEEIVERIVGDLGLARVGVLFQDDSYGRSGLAGVKQALERRGLELAGSEAYMRNTTAVKAALLGLKRRDPQAIVIVGAYQPSATFTQWARKLGLSVPIFNVSFVGSAALVQALGPAGEGVYISQVVPFPSGDSIPLLAEYRQALVANDATAPPSFGSLEGYIAGRLTAEVLRKAGENPTRASFLKALVETGTFDIGGFELAFGKGDNSGSDEVFLTVIKDGDIVPAERLSQ